MGQAVPFIYLDGETGLFELNQEAINIFQQSQTKKLAILCICGGYRTGKSFLLN